MSVEVVDLETVRNAGRRGPNTIVAVIGLLIAAILFGVVIASPRPAPSPSSPSPASAVSLATQSPEASLAATPRPSRPRPTVPPTLPAPTPYPWEWRSVVVDAFISGVQILRMWSLPDRVVALISTEGEGGELTPGLMVSLDGENWARGLVPVPGFQFSAGAVANDRLWVLGYSRPDSESPPKYTMWSTSDGSTWSSPGDLEGFRSGAIDVSFMERGPGGWVAIARQAPTSIVAPPGMSIEVSADGVHWRTAKQFADRSKSAVGLANDGTRWILVIEGDAGADGVEVTALRSIDGRSWTSAPVATFSGYVSGVSAGPGGFLVVGGETVTAERPRAWLSTGGREWTTVQVPPGAGRPSAGVLNVVTTEVGYLAIGRFSGETWRSANGVDWVSFPAWQDIGTGSLMGVTTIGDRIVAWGLAGEADVTIFIGSLERMVR